MRFSNCNEHRLLNGRFKRWKHFEEYCENSTVHGLRYFPNNKIHLFERVFWITSVFCSIVACCIAISESYKKWKENPVMVTFSEKMTSLNGISFPAVTVCAETKTDKKLFNYRSTLLKLDPQGDPPYYGLSEREFTLVAAQFQICESHILQNTDCIGENITTENIFDLIREVAPNMSDTLISCRYRTYPSDCDNFFQEVITDDGLCFTFNSLTSQEMFTDGDNVKIMSDRYETGVSNCWSLEDGFDDKVNNLCMYPHRVFKAGSKAGLQMSLGIKESNMDYVCRGPAQGFKVILHSPNELPQVTGQYFRIPVGQDVRVSIKPNILRTTKSLKGHSPKRRQCYFNSERKLRYLKIYTQRNCELECLANFTLSKCGCVKFSMPRSRNTPICGIAKTMCYNSAEDDLLEDAGKTETEKQINRCDCLPACTSISYDAEISQATYEWKKFFVATNISVNYAKGFQFASLSIFFKENQFITSKRSELVGLTDFISACGGLLGLFMGVSLLSIVEFIYYFSLRLFCSMRSRKIEEKSRISSMEKLKQKWKRSIRPDPIWTSRTWYIGK